MTQSEGRENLRAPSLARIVCYALRKNSHHSSTTYFRAKGKTFKTYLICFRSLDIWRQLPCMTSLIFSFSIFHLRRRPGDELVLAARDFVRPISPLGRAPCVSA